MLPGTAANNGRTQMLLGLVSEKTGCVYNRRMYHGDAEVLQSAQLTSIEICAGAGGQSLGLEMAGFDHVCLVELDKDACASLRLNRPHWNVIHGNVRDFSAPGLAGIDLLAGGVPCPPFSKAGKQLGDTDERDLFPEALRLVAELRPKAVMLENVRGLLDKGFDEYRQSITNRLMDLGYAPDWRLLQASSFGVPQLRPRVIMVAVRNDLKAPFTWPDPASPVERSVGDVLVDLMGANGWEGAAEWSKLANRIAPTIVGGSKKHGGPDLGPTRARKAWEALSVNGKIIGNASPEPGFSGMPNLTVRMVARLQGFPDSWQFAGAKTSAYRQVGNAFPPPVAKAVGEMIAKCIRESIANDQINDEYTFPKCETEFSRESVAVGAPD